MDDLHVNGKLATVVVEDKDANTAAARLKGAAEARPEVGLVNDGEALLNIARLGHGDNVTTLEVEHTVLLEDGAEHCLHNNAGGRVGDKRRLLVQLAGEEVNTEVAVLTSGRGGGNADDLAGAALEHQEVTDANVMAGNGDRVGQVLAGLGAAATRSRSRTLADLYINVLLVVVATRVDDAVSQLVDAVAEGVVVTWGGKD